MAGPKTARRAGKQWWRNLFGRLLRSGRDNADLKSEADLAYHQAQERHTRAARSAAGVQAQVNIKKEDAERKAAELVELDEDIAVAQAAGQRIIAENGYTNAEEAMGNPDFAEIKQDIAALKLQRDSVQAELDSIQAALAQLEPQAASVKEAIANSTAALRETAAARQEVYRNEDTAEAMAAVNANIQSLQSDLNLDVPQMGDILQRARSKMHTEQGVAEFAADDPEMQAAAARRRAADRRRSAEVDDMFSFGSTDTSEPAGADSVAS